MKVNGIAFKKAREEIRKNVQKRKMLRGEAGEGTQEWLAEVAKVRSPNGEIKSLSVRSIQYLEQGTASIATIDAVSGHLFVNGRELIIGYGNNFINLDSPSVVDLRPYSSPYDNLDFYQSSFLLTIDPLVITFTENDDIDTSRLINITANVKFEHLNITMGWLYKVKLIPGGNGWLGIQDEVFSEGLYAPTIYRASIMFNQIDMHNVSWGELVETVEKSTEKMLQITVTVEFEYFIKEIKIGVITSELGTLFRKGRLKRSSEWPFFAQPQAIIWK